VPLLRELSLGLCVGFAACTQGRAAPAACATPAAAPSDKPNFDLTASIKELMDSEVDPAADFLWDSVATISRLDGIEERRPHTDEAWQEVRRRALTLIEATNLLVMDGRRVSHNYIAAAGEDELDTNQAQAKIEGNRAAFNGFAAGLRAAGRQALHAIDAQDPEALFDTGSIIDAACESCHSVFWYPKRGDSAP
jgi:hypothetical protein